MAGRVPKEHTELVEASPIASWSSACRISSTGEFVHSGVSPTSSSTRASHCCPAVGALLG
ncbi:hypothetical protein BSKO_03980 [Bryopsis sp. KO-2023]|nr:hypothetical protein BSKO_03980 [Bryopsis sp. KO-2023]